jgi:hypothetical protein
MMKSCSLRFACRATEACDLIDRFPLTFRSSARSWPTNPSPTFFKECIFQWPALARPHRRALANLCLAFRSFASATSQLRTSSDGAQFVSCDVPFKGTSAVVCSVGLWLREARLALAWSVSSTEHFVAAMRGRPCTVDYSISSAMKFLSVGAHFSASYPLAECPSSVSISQ